MIGRIALVLQSTAAGGMETHVIDLAHEYARRGIRVLAVVPEGEAFDDVALRFGTPGVAVVRLNSDARDGRRAQLSSARRYLGELRAFRPDVVHLHTGGATGGLAALALARTLTSATVVLTEHDVPAPAPGTRRRFARSLVDRSAHLVVAVSRRNAAIRRERLGMRCRSFAAVLNGVPIPARSSAERAADRVLVRNRHGIPADALVLGSLVRLAPGKGIDDLIRAFALVRDRLPAKLLFVGDGPLRNEAEALARELGLAADIVFAGNQPEPRPYLEAMDIFALAVPSGSMSIALLEAMARGLPPVITFCGPEEAVIDGESGLGAPPSDPRGLAAVLTRIGEDPALRLSLGVKADAHVARHFSVARVADDLLEAYATARCGQLAVHLRADSPPNPRPGDNRARVSDGEPATADAA